MNVGDTDSTVEAKPDERIHPWTRYVALGDSFTEGIGDPEPDNRPGWSSTHSMCRTTSSRCSLSRSPSAVGAKPAQATSYGHASILSPGSSGGSGTGPPVTESCRSARRRDPSSVPPTPSCPGVEREPQGVSQGAGLSW